MPCVRIWTVAGKGLRVLGLNILGRFLSAREQNLKYVALETLQQLLRTDTAAVTRHRETLLDCLKVYNTPSIIERAPMPHPDLSFFSICYRLPVHVDSMWCF